jgi:hypothetical protein
MSEKEATDFCNLIAKGTSYHSFMSYLLETGQEARHSRGGYSAMALAPRLWIIRYLLRMITTGLYKET